MGGGGGGGKKQREKYPPPPSAKQQHPFFKQYKTNKKHWLNIKMDINFTKLENHIQSVRKDTRAHL